MESIEEQVMRLHGGTLDSAQSDTDDLGAYDDDETVDATSEPLALRRIDEQEEATLARLQRDQLAASLRTMAASADTPAVTRKERLRQRIAAHSVSTHHEDTPEAFQKWLDDEDDGGGARPSSSLSAAKLDTRTEVEKFLEDNDDTPPAFSAEVMRSAYMGSSNTTRNNSSLRSLPPADSAHIAGLWSWIKSFWHYALYPLSDEHVSGSVPAVIRDAGSDNALTLEATPHTDTMTMDGGDNKSKLKGLKLKRVAGVPGSLVYEGNFTHRRDNFFSNPTTQPEPETVTVTFKHPVTYKTLSWPLAGVPEATRALKIARTWATVPDASGTSLVLRFAKSGKNPILRQVIVLYQATGATDMSAAPTLSKSELDLAKHILAGKQIDLAALHDKNTLGTGAAAGYTAICTAACDVHAAFAHIAVPPMHVATMGFASKGTDTALFQQYASDLGKLGSAAQSSGTMTGTMRAQQRGTLLGKYLQTQLAGASNPTIIAAVHALANVAEVFHMRTTGGPAQDSRRRVDMFLAAKPALRQNPKQTFQTFWG